jgi:hypothetical protein
VTCGHHQGDAAGVQNPMVPSRPSRAYLCALLGGHHLTIPSSLVPRRGKGHQAQRQLTRIEQRRSPADHQRTAQPQRPLSSGAVEGNVNRIKMIKRQMYGRASFDLLRKRVILAA